MTQFKVTLAFAAILLVPACFAKDCGVKSVATHEGRIVNGENAAPNEFPWQVSWRFFNSSTNTHRHVCGGSVVSNQWIVTAAHCVDLFGDVNKIKPSDFRAAVGIILQSEVAPANTLEIEQIYVHPGWDRNKIINDIAVAKVKGEVNLEGRGINAICLGSSSDVTEGKQAVMSGWGLTEHGGSAIPNNLQRATVKVERQSDCKSIYSIIKPLSDGEVCAGKNPGACNGDSGGPLQYEVNGRWYLLGAASWVVRCGHSTFPTVYTRVPHFLSFIKEKTGLTPP